MKQQSFINDNREWLMTDGQKPYNLDFLHNDDLSKLTPSLVSNTYDLVNLKKCKIGFGLHSCPDWLLLPFPGKQKEFGL